MPFVDDSKDVPQNEVQISNILIRENTISLIREIVDFRFSANLYHFDFKVHPHPMCTFARFSRILKRTLAKVLGCKCAFKILYLWEKDVFCHFFIILKLTFRKQAVTRS